MTSNSRTRVGTEQTMRDLRETFNRWKDVEFWEPVPDAPRSPGVTVRYLRSKTWQQVHCDRFSDRSQNIRQIYLFLDRLRIAEQHGVSYTGLSSGRAIVEVGEQEQKRGWLEDAYFTLGCTQADPDELIRDLYLKKAKYYHPDHGGDKERFVQLKQAYDAICESRGMRS